MNLGSPVFSFKAMVMPVEAISGNGGHKAEPGEGLSLEGPHLGSNGVPLVNFYVHDFILPLKNSCITQFCSDLFLIAIKIVINVPWQDHRAFSIMTHGHRIQDCQLLPIGSQSK